MFKPRSDLRCDPAIEIDLDKIECNARTIVNQCADNGIEAIGVTKVTCGMPQVARAMLRGGVKSIGESRLENVTRLRNAGITAPIMLLRIPPISSAADVIELVDVSLNSEIKVLRALSAAAIDCGKIHDVVIMVDLGDLREGVWPNDIPSFIERATELEGINVIGIGTNLSCYGGVIPTRENMNLLVRTVEEIEQQFGIKIKTISGGNTSALPLMMEGGLPKRINQLRIGEGIMLGRETIEGKPWPGTAHDALTIRAEIIELKKKPSIPIGSTSRDAFGNTPVFNDKGIRLRAIMNTGREDVLISGLTPVDHRIEILGASSDHMILDVTDSSESMSVGDEIAFLPNYGALLAAMTSAYVDKRPKTSRRAARELKSVEIISGPGGGFLATDTCKQSLRSLDYKVTESTIYLNDDMLQPAVISDIVKTSRIASNTIAKLISNHIIPVIAASDSNLRLSCFMALRQAAPEHGLIIFDSHSNFHTPSSTSRIPFSRMVMAAALGHGIESIDIPLPMINPENTVIIGVRDVDKEETYLLLRSRITVFTMEDIDSMGVKEVVERALKIASVGTSGIHVSFDLDVMDPAQIPSLDDSVLGGLTYREAQLCMEIIARSRALVSLDIAIGERTDENRPTAERFACDFVLSAFGKRIFGKAE